MKDEWVNLTTPLLYFKIDDMNLRRPLVADGRISLNQAAKSGVQFTVFPQQTAVQIQLWAGCRMLPLQTDVMLPNVTDVSGEPGRPGEAADAGLL